MSTNDPLIGMKLGDYTIKDLLGKGGMARVYRGYDEALDRFAAVKVIEPQLVSGEDDEEYRERFVREARAIARLNHPRVVGIFQFGDIDKELYYMAMVFVEGSDLRHILKDYISKDQYLSYAQILKIVTDIAEALDYSHLQGVIHRDVKPSNIMVTGDGHAVLTDFGLALNTSEGTIGNTFGSVHYIAPEQAVSSAQAVPQSDLYSLGVVLYEMLVGRVPFEDMSAMSVALKHISDPPPEPSLINPKITPQIEEVVMKILDKDPRRRYQTGTALIHALQGAFAASPDEDTEELDDASPLPESAVAVIERPKTQPKPIPIAMPDHLSVSEDDDPPTISDSSPYKPIASETARGKQTASTSASELLSKPEEKKSRVGLYILGVVVIAIVVVGLLLLSSGDGDGGDNTEGTQTADALVAMVTDELTDTPTLAQSEPTATEDIVAETDDVSPTDTDEPVLVTETEESVTETPMPSATDTVVLETNTPDVTATPEATATPLVESSPTLSLTVTADDPQLILRYDGRTIALYNRAPSNVEIDISDLTFVRQDDDEAIIFEASEWDSPRLDGMRSRLDCFQVLSLRFTSLPTDEYPLEICRFVQGVMQTPRTFWINSVQDATFDVMRNDTVLATCPVVSSSYRGEVYCEVELRDD